MKVVNARLSETSSSASRASDHRNKLDGRMIYKLYNAKTGAKRELR